MTAEEPGRGSTTWMPVETVSGPGRLSIDATTDPRAVLLLGHGAGGGVDAFDLSALARALPSRGVTVLRFEQPWRTAGRRIAGPPASLDRAWKAALAQVSDRFSATPLFVGGRSAGARVACRGFAAPALGVVALSFPLHPPGKPQASRFEELAAVKAPRLVVQGANDPFGTPDELRRALASELSGDVTVVEVPGASHSFEPRSQAARARAEATAATINAAVAALIERVLR